MKEQLWDDNAEAIEEFVYSGQLRLTAALAHPARHLMASGGMSERMRPKCLFMSTADASCC